MDKEHTNEQFLPRSVKNRTPAPKKIKQKEKEKRERNEISRWKQRTRLP